jgi:uncharacterized protein
MGGVPMEKFSETVSEKLKCYVYRLIDPRNGMTFYVGRGRDNRVFDHDAEQLKATDSEDNQSLKLKKIREIRNSGLEVVHVIHRHGMDDEKAREVEAALIDAYPGLANIQSGFENDRGIRHAKEIISYYEAEEAIFHHKLILININKSYENRDLYDAVRFAWKISIDKAKEADYVLAVRKGQIEGVYKAEEWLEATTDNFPISSDIKGRFGFRGHEACDDVKKLYIGKRIPQDQRKRGSANPIRYIKL